MPPGWLGDDYEQTWSLMGRPSSDTAESPPDKLPKVENALNTPNIWSSLTQQCSMAHCTQRLYPEPCTQHSLHNTPQHLYPSTLYTVPVHSTLHSAPRINHPVHNPCTCIHSLYQAADWELWSLLLPSTKGASDCSSVAREGPKPELYKVPLKPSQGKNPKSDPYASETTGSH